MENSEQIYFHSFDSQVNKTEPHFIPKSSHQMLVNASIGGGKTTLILCLMLSKNGYYQRFNKILWCSPTARLDEKIQLVLRNPKNKIIVPNKKLIKAIIARNKNNGKYRLGNGGAFGTEVLRYVETTEARPFQDSDFTEDTTFSFITELINHQDSIIKTFGKDLADDILIVLDDSASNKKALMNPEVIKSVLTSRHFKISTIFVTQCYHNIPKPIRLNCHCKIIFDCPNVKELETIYSENTCGFSNKEFENIFRAVHRRDYCFVSINQLNPKGCKLAYNFEFYISSFEQLKEILKKKYKLIIN